jgi:hypothetical protein
MALVLLNPDKLRCNPSRFCTRRHSFLYSLWEYSRMVFSKAELQQYTCGTTVLCFNSAWKVVVTRVVPWTILSRHDTHISACLRQWRMGKSLPSHSSANVGYVIVLRGVLLFLAHLRCSYRLKSLPGYWLSRYPEIMSIMTAVLGKKGKKCSLYFEKPRHEDVCVSGFVVVTCRNTGKSPNALSFFFTDMEVKREKETGLICTHKTVSSKQNLTYPKHTAHAYLNECCSCIDFLYTFLLQNFIIVHSFFKEPG